MKRLKISIVALLTVMGVVVYGLLPFFNVECATDPCIVITDVEETEREGIEDLVIQINNDTDKDEHLEVKLLTYGDNGSSGVSDVKVIFKMSQYKNLSQESKEKAMNIILNDINDSDNISFANKTRLYNFIAGEDTAVSSLVRQLSNDVNADFVSAYSKFRPFTGLIGTILGILTLLIFMLLAFTITCDLAYMTIPFWRNFLDSGAEQGKKPWSVSLEAYKATQTVENDNSGTKEVISEYLKQKVKQLVAIALCLLYLVSGQIYQVIANIIDYFSGILS